MGKHPRRRSHVRDPDTIRRQRRHRKVHYAVIGICVVIIGAGWAGLHVFGGEIAVLVLAERLAKIGIEEI